MKYKKGVAIGMGQIDSDSLFFRYHDETWEFPIYDVVGYRGFAHYNGVHWEAKVSDLRLLAARMKKKERAHG